uniref:Lysine-rich coiled-coil protein 1 n=1 Tax=Equus asinus TaxID=9793 RepID=A0A9L0K2U1_EQUAS
MENSMAYDSFQHELEDYIRKQKARGLQPEHYFRKVTEDSGYRERGHPAPRPLRLEQSLFRSSHRFPGSYQRLRTVESQLRPRSKIHHSRQILESLNHCQKNHDNFLRNPWLPRPGGEAQVERKRKHRADGDSHKENRGRAQAEPGSAEKPKYSKKSNQDPVTTKEGRRSGREKKRSAKESPRETDLWDEAILGSSY